MHPYRVFISYAREDRALAERAARGLEAAGLVPVWDRDIGPGRRFGDAIKSGIATAHVFMPLITEQSQRRPWVHQETGYAIGVDVPVLPVAVNTLPGELIAELQAMAVQPDLSDFPERLRSADLDRLVLRARPTPLVGTQVEEEVEKRTERLVGCARWLLDARRYVHVRQRALFSSLSIPDRDPRDPVWDRYDGSSPKPLGLRQLLREERIAIERHVRMKGGTFVLAPELAFGEVGADVHRVQLETLLDVLASLPHDHVSVVFSGRVDDGNVTVLGDWFVAFAPVPRSRAALRQTVFSSHGPTVLEWIRRFDQQVEEAADPSAGPSRLADAVARLRERLEALPR